MTFRHNNIYLRNIKKEFQILIVGPSLTKIYTFQNGHLTVYVQHRKESTCFVYKTAAFGSAIDFRGLKPL